MADLVLASASPRRAELLRQLGVPFRVAPTAIDETPLDRERPAAYVTRIALQKAAAALTAAPTALVLAADTTVVIDERILGKPDGPDQARAMLEALRGRRHQVLTAVALADAERTDQVTHSSAVHFRDLRDAEIAAYIATAEPYDKAGGYAVQGLAQAFIQRLEGSYSSVMGLPLSETAELLHGFGLSPERYWSQR